MAKQKKRKILISPLNWGLGHATRLVPVIQALLADGHSIFLAGESPSIDILKETFPHLPCYELKGFKVRLSSGKKQWKTLLRQTPALLKAIAQEKKQTKSLAQEHNIDLIISDNRYGVYANNIPSVIITHQTKPSTGNKLSLLRLLSNRISYLWLKKFDSCWIPDTPNANNLSGSLSDPLKNIKTHYIGHLSRLHSCSKTKVNTSEVLVIISGPEPQRTQLQNLIIQVFNKRDEKVIIINGQINNKTQQINNIQVLSNVSASHLKELISNSSHIICRSGYSTLMDLVYCKKTALLIPTPGQFEQEYLAQRASQQFGFNSLTQSNLNKADYQTILSQSLCSKTLIDYQTLHLPELPY